jgi:hypothetical protein
MSHTSGDPIGCPRTVLNVRPTFLDPLHAMEGTRAEIAAARYLAKGRGVGLLLGAFPVTILRTRA